PLAIARGPKGSGRVVTEVRMTKPATNRRERIREATLIEIRTVARELLVRHGSSAVTINAVAREMGMSGPALYRYYASHEELVAAVTADFYRELGTVMEKARYAHPQDAAAQRPRPGWGPLTWRSS